jgi:hypothetical protein
VGIAIGTGAWRTEAMFKLWTGNVNVDGLPLATSDDDRNCKRIMEIAAE